jgi:hypothetical protein
MLKKPDKVTKLLRDLKLPFIHGSIRNQNCLAQNLAACYALLSFTLALEGVGMTKIVNNFPR